LDHLIFRRQQSGPAFGLGANATKGFEPVLPRIAGWPIRNGNAPRRNGLSRIGDPDALGQDGAWHR
jgi:hypothetical protein